MFTRLVKANNFLLLKVSALSLLAVVSTMGYVFYFQNAVFFELPVLETSDIKAYKNAAGFVIMGDYLYGDDFRYVSGSDLPWIMSPFAALIFAPLLVIPDGLLYPVQIVFNLFMVLSIILIILRKEILSMRFIPAVFTILGLLYLSAAYSPVQNALLTGQVNILLLVLIIIDTVYLKDKNSKFQGFLTGVAAGIKIVPLIFIVYYFLTKQYRSAVKALVGFFATVTVGFTVIFESSVEYWARLGFLRNTSHLEDYISNIFNQSINGLILRSENIPYELKQTTWFIVAASVGVVVLGFAAHLYKKGYILESVLIVGFGSLLCSPLSWIHHGVWVVPAMLMFLKYSWVDQKYFFYWVFGSILLIKQFLGNHESNIMFAWNQGYWFNLNWWVIVYTGFIVLIMFEYFKKSFISKEAKLNV